MGYDERSIKPRTWAHSPKDIPEGEHYAIIEFGSISIPGDERSRTNPGHGYPARTEAKTDYIVFNDKEGWLHEIKERTERKSNYEWIAVHSRRVKITTDVKVDVE